jgi:AhpD family alkylhydroperoxidase
VPDAGIVSTQTSNGWIASIDPGDATGALAEAYQSQVEKIGRVTELTQIGSLYPDLVAARLRLYAVVDATPSDVPDHVRRAVALLTSVLNGCLFCTVGQTEKLTEAGHGELARAIKDDPEGAATGDAKADVTALREAGWSDLDILDINNISAYYCYINRVAAGLGLQREA